MLDKVKTLYEKYKDYNEVAKKLIQDGCDFQTADAEIEKHKNQSQAEEQLKAYEELQQQKAQEEATKKKVDDAVEKATQELEAKYQEELDKVNSLNEYKTTEMDELSKQYKVATDKLKGLSVMPSGVKYPDNKENVLGRDEGACFSRQEYKDSMVQLDNFIRALKFEPAGSTSHLSIGQEIAQHNKQSYKKQLASFYNIKANVSDVDTQGGHAVPTPVMDDIIRQSYKKSVMLPNVMIERTLENDKIIPGISSFTLQEQTNQNTDLTNHTNVLNANTIVLKPYGGLTDYSKTLMFQRPDIASDFVGNFMTAYNVLLDTIIMTGTSSGGGIYQSTSLTGRRIVNATDLTLTTLNQTHIETLRKNLSIYVDPMKACFISNRDVFFSLANQKIGTSDAPAFPGIYNMGVMDKDLTIFGHKYLVNNQIANTYTDGLAASTGGTNRTGLYLVDLSRVYLGLGMDLMIDTSEHYRFGRYQNTIRAFCRLGVQVVETPADGTHPIADLGTVSRGISGVLEVATA